MPEATNERTGFEEKNERTVARRAFSCVAVELFVSLMVDLKPTTNIPTDVRFSVMEVNPFSFHIFLHGRIHLLPLNRTTIRLNVLSIHL